MAVNVHDLVKKRALVTRESATVIRDILAQAFNESEPELVLDLTGIDAVTPSFVDEALSFVEASLRDPSVNPRRVVFLNPPTRLSSKFAAIGRGRGLVFSETEEGSWIVERAAAESAH